ncbi:hypothetical protein FOYG_10995 [Fusarium oxysporum NRRL 32931]|uniref:Uncharacterized protein n=1 Tax=Fusarium oxysporum NRRL 32931 TaxID=660029 RepID=W9HZN8_FUSOX|nr:hypothetical protein FOYG_10995 [Fusarium oxysporum NRRL 32931]EWY86455.1 hypothetical protein FOYG_10995 [Fusarium oxysporum NRRL 32931]EWY86456.1 hypothetical protein FOYG_10995 [Fusarium oxysporum NRRL 32931]
MPMRLSPISGMEGREKAKKQQQKNTLLVKGRDPQARGAAVWLVGMRSISQRTHTCTCRQWLFSLWACVGEADSQSIGDTNYQGCRRARPELITGRDFRHGGLLVLIS